MGATVAPLDPSAACASGGIRVDAANGNVVVCNGPSGAGSSGSYYELDGVRSVLLVAHRWRQLKPGGGSRTVFLPAEVKGFAPATVVLPASLPLTSTVSGNTGPAGNNTFLLVDDGVTPVACRYASPVPNGSSYALADCRTGFTDGDGTSLPSYGTGTLLPAPSSVAGVQRIKLRIDGGTSAAPSSLRIELNLGLF